MTSVRFVLVTMGFVCCMTLGEVTALAQFFIPPTARIVGHVFCADTNAPARLARVTLAQVFEKTAKRKYRAPDHNEHLWVTTDVDGGFAAENIEPGTYYVIADLPGYLNEIALSPEEHLANPTTEAKLLNPSAELMDLIDKSFPKVQVYQGQTAQVEIRLQRGAGFSGTVRYEDGSPAVGITIQLRRLVDKDVKQGPDAPATARPIRVEATTDDLGRYRISGLPAGKFAAKFTMREASQVHHPSEHAVDIYAGGAFREKDATPIKLASGSEVTGDIVVPLSKLYRVSGVITSLEDSHPLNSGTVQLLYAEDGVQVSESTIGYDGSFRFTLVPKGEYQLSVGASEVEWLDYSASKGLKNYEPATQPLRVVDRDVSDVVVQLKPKSSDSQ